MIPADRLVGSGICWVGEAPRTPQPARGLAALQDWANGLRAGPRRTLSCDTCPFLYTWGFFRGISAGRVCPDRRAGIEQDFGQLQRGVLFLLKDARSGVDVGEWASKVGAVPTQFFAGIDLFWSSFVSTTSIR